MSQHFNPPGSSSISLQPSPAKIDASYVCHLSILPVSRFPSLPGLSRYRVSGIITLLHSTAHSVPPHRLYTLRNCSKHWDLGNRGGWHLLLPSWVRCQYDTCEEEEERKRTSVQGTGADMTRESSSVMTTRGDIDGIIVWKNKRYLEFVFVFIP
jgi:hypothetical protein